MQLWMIVSKAVYERIQQGEIYRITDMDDEMKYCPWAYEWLNAEMEKRVGRAPEGVVAPLHGWLRWETERIRPDLRWMRWNWHPQGEHVLLQLDVPEEKVLFIDAPSWTDILNKWLISDSEA